ncbi:MAG TPA: nuclease PIN [Micrococcaceae bacterium]
MKFRLFAQERAGLEILSTMARGLGPAVLTLSEMLAAPAADHAALAERLHTHEAETASLQVSLMTQMRSSFINPLPREDLFTLSRYLTDAMEKLDGAGELILIYRLERTSRRASELLDIIARQTEITAEVVRTLDDLDEAEDYWIETLRLAKRADHTHRVYVGELLADHKPASYAKHRDLADALKGVTTDMRRLATTVGSIIVKEA